MKDTVYITGHKNPDTDSVISAIAYAEYKNRTVTSDAVPIRLGPLNRETKFILEYFGVEEPRFMETMKLQVKDLDYDKTQPIEPEISLKMAWNLMHRNNVNSLVVADGEDFLKGIVTVSSLTSSYMDVWDTTVVGKAGTSLDNILETLSGEIILLPENPRPFSGKMLVISLMAEDASEVIEENDITVMGNIGELQIAAAEKNVSLMIITGNHGVGEDVLKECSERGITVIKTPHDTFTAARLLPQSVPVKSVMAENNITYFNEDEFVDDISPVMTQTRYRSYPIVNSEKRVMGTLSRYHLISQVRKKIILVDHNERSQSIDGLEHADILEIIDHHRVADVATGSPIYFRNEPVGSTSTIISSIFFENGIRPSKKTAGLLCAAIISDTLYFKSPTSTNTDRMALERLLKIAHLDADEFAMEMFRAGTSLEGKTPEQLLAQDFKTFTLDDQKIGISQVYSLDAEALTDYKDDLLSLMDKRAEKEEYTIYGLLITDIFKEESELIVTGPNKELLETAFDKKLSNNSMVLPGVLSRKKQVIPVVTQVLLSRR